MTDVGKHYSAEPPNSATRAVGGLIIVVLVLAFIALYVYPGYTAQDFAWTISPGTSAMLIGAGYIAGGYFFVRAITAKKWHHVKSGFLPITAFTICMLAATILHWGRFHQGTFIFYFWTVIYVITPLLVPVLWWTNRTRDAHTLDDRDLRFLMSVRRGLGAVAIVGLLFCLTAFMRPAILISAAPWKLTELTARVFSGWSLLAFATLLAVVLDGRWSATRILVQAAMVAQALTLLALPRMWNDLNHTSPMTILFVGGVAAALIVFAGVHVWLDRRVRRISG
jgi:hypothetical protein